MKGSWPTAGIVVALALACVLDGAHAEPTGDLVALRAGARTVLLGRCLPCHSNSADGAKPEALAVFDLDIVDWSKTLSDERLPKLLGRLQSNSTPAEQTKVQQFIDAELSARLDAPAASSASAW